MCVYFKELVHIIMGADKSEICRAEIQGRVDATA